MAALKSAPFRQQHESLRKCIARIQKHLNPFLLAQNAADVRTELTQLLGEFGKHLQLEAKDLYPVLDAVPEAKPTAERFNAEMKQRLPSVAEFNRRWPNAAAIRAEGSLFIKEAEGVLKWLDQRILAENRDLYPLLDKQDLASMAHLNNPDLKIARI